MCFPLSIEILARENPYAGTYEPKNSESEEDDTWTGLCFDDGRNRSNCFVYYWSKYHERYRGRPRKKP